MRLSQLNHLADAKKPGEAKPPPGCVSGVMDEHENPSPCQGGGEFLLKFQFAFFKALLNLFLYLLTPHILQTRTGFLPLV